MAGKFVFALQPLLEQRKRIEETKRRAFAAIRQVRDEGSREIDRLANALDAGGFASHACAAAGNTRDLRVYDAHLRFLTAAIASRRAHKVASQAAFDRASGDLIEANRERRLIEKLRERRLAEYEAREARLDELEIEEANRKRPSSFDKLRMTLGR